jgi:gluconate 2-dehydrogenase gamma chain
MKEMNRRDFVHRTGLYGVGVLAGLHLPRPDAARAAAESSAPAVLSTVEWKTLEALTARVIPTDHQPGAREAHCVNFIDKALANEDAAAVPLYKGGLAALDGIAVARSKKSFADLEATQQDAILRDVDAGTAAEWTLEQLPSPLFFETARQHTIIAFLADPSYGGNRDYAGWKVSGYPGPRHRRGGFTPAQVEGSEPIVPIWDRKG